MILQGEVIVFKKLEGEQKQENPKSMENQNLGITAAVLPKLGFPVIRKSSALYDLTSNDQMILH